MLKKTIAIAVAVSLKATATIQVLPTVPWFESDDETINLNIPDGPGYGLATGRIVKADVASATTDKTTAEAEFARVKEVWESAKPGIEEALTEWWQGREHLEREPHVLIRGPVSYPISSGYSLLQRQGGTYYNDTGQMEPTLKRLDSGQWVIEFDHGTYPATEKRTDTTIIPLINSVAEKIRNDDDILTGAAMNKEKELKNNVDEGVWDGMIASIDRYLNTTSSGTYGAVTQKIKNQGGVTNIISLGENEVRRIDSDYKHGEINGNKEASTIQIGQRTGSTLRNGEANVAVGDESRVSGNGVAFGAKTYASGNSVALGYMSRTLREDAPGSVPEVSVGSAGDRKGEGAFTRKITNVTEGVNPTDAATVSNVTKALDDAKKHTNTEIGKLKNDMGEVVRGQVGKALEGVTDKWQESLKKVTEEGRDGGTDSGSGSYAAGKDAEALNKHSVALGEKSMTTRDYEVNIGSWEATTEAEDGSSGPKTQKTRILSGVSDGEKDDEAVNRKQLNDVASTANREAASAKKDAVREANGYTDETAKKTLETANEHTERRAVVAENNAVTRSNAYTDDSSSRTLERANTYTNHRAAQAENNAVARSNAYTDNRFGELRKSLQQTEKRLNAGIAGVTAISSIPYAAGNKFSYGIGAGNYQNGNAIAAGVQFRVSQSANVRLNVSWDSAGNNATGVGIAGGW